MSGPHRRILVLAAAVALVVLAGCSGTPTSTPEPSHSPLPESVTVSWEGSQTTRLTVPEGAQSLRVHVACTSGRFLISANTDLANDRHGFCGGMTTVVIPLPTTSWMEVIIAVDEAESLVAELDFSDRPLEVDAAVAEDCEALGLFYGLFQDAEIGLETGMIDEAAWRSAIDDATATLDGMTPSPLLERQVVVLHEWISAVDAPGFWKARTDPEVGAADILASQVCTDNGSTIRVVRQYGG